MAIPAAANLLAWLALGAGVGFVVVRQQALNERLDKADESPATLSKDPAAAGAPAPLASGGMNAKTEDEFKKLRVENSELRETVKTLRTNHDRLAEIVMATPEGQAAEVAAGSSSKFVEKPGFEDAVRAVVDRYATEQKFRDALKKATGPIVPKKPLYAELAKALKLTDNQSARFEEDIRGIQTELFQVLQIPREDGVVPLEEIQQAEQYPEGNPKRAEPFLKLIKNTIPGTQETYWERALTLVSRVRKSSQSYLDESQRNLLDTIDLDWFGIKMQ